jgi:hypothetical protein
MDFQPGTVYQNASGQFRVVSVGPTMIKLVYLTGPQAGPKPLLKQLATMATLRTAAVTFPADQ